MKQERAGRGFKRRLVSAVNMPKEVVLGDSVINLLGRNEIWIENYRGIIEYTDQLLRIQTKQTQIHLHGKQFRIEHYTNEGMKVTGMIDTIEFCK